MKREKNTQTQVHFDPILSDRGRIKTLHAIKAKNTCDLRARKFLRIRIGIYVSWRKNIHLEYI